MKSVHIIAGMIGLMLSLGGMLLAAEEPIQLSDRVTLSAGEPVVVALSQPGEKRWGYHQFPEFCGLPDGRILVRFHATADAVKAYGDAKPTYISADQGATWQFYQEKDLPPIGLIGEVFDGEFICAGSTVPFDLRKHNLAMPKPAGGFNAYVDNYFFKAQECPAEVQTYVSSIPAYRWTPRTKAWTQETMRYDLRNGLIWTRAGGEEAYMVARSFLEYTPLRVGKELLYADYRQNFCYPDGSVPKNGSVSLMVSPDNGRSFSCRSIVYSDPTGKYTSSEPMLAVASNGDLACVIRRSHQIQKSMLITFSKDQGRSWGEPFDLKDLDDFGVWPRLLQLECGAMVLSYGRPGVRMAYSLDGSGRTWTKPVTVIAGDPKNNMAHSCGYTNLLALDANSFLLVYSDFQYPSPKGKPCKAILVRKYKLTLHK